MADEVPQEDAGLVRLRDAIRAWLETSQASASPVRLRDVVLGAGITVHDTGSQDDGRLLLL